MNSSNTFHRIVIFSLAGMVALLVINAGISYFNIRQLYENASQVSHTHEVIAGLEKILSLVKDAELRQRNYLITGDASYLSPYQNTIKSLDAQFATVANLIRDNPRQQAIFPKLREQAVKRVRILHEVSELRKEVDGFEIARNSVLTNQGKEAMEALRFTVSDMVEHERGLLLLRSVRSERTYQTVLFSGFLAGLTGLIVAGMFVVVIERNVRAELRASAALHEQRQLLYATLASIGDGVIATDNESRVTFLNAVASELTGWSSEEAARRPLLEIFKIINETTRLSTENPALRALHEGIIVGLANHTLLVSKDGAERPIDDSAAPIRDVNGQVNGAVLVFRDVTERRQHDRELEARQQQFVTLSESIPQLAWMANADGHIFWYNRRWYEYTGTTFDQMAGWGWQSVHDPVVLPTVMKRWKAAIATGELFDMTFPLRGADGIYRPFLTRVVPMKNEAGHVVRWFGTNTDISEVKRVEEELRESEARFRTLVDNLPDLIARLNLELRYMYVSPAVQPLLGLKTSELLDRTLAETGFPAAVSASFTELCRAAQRTRQTQTFEFDDDRTGSQKSFISKIIPELDSHGKVDSFLILTTDVTAQKNLENELRKLVSDLSEVDRRKNEFLATLAHELRNPLAPIRNGLQLLQLSNNQTESTGAACLIINRQLSQLVRLVDDLLDIGRINQGKIELRLEPIALETVVNSAVETSRPLIDQMGHTLIANLPEQPVTLMADLTRLSQIILNLLNNAAKYSERGGHIWLKAELLNNELIISVRDSGIGIASEHLPRIFEMFSQVDHSLQRSQGGLGIGLSLAKRLTELHGGRIEATSAGLGKGSEFIIRLPLTEGTTMSSIGAHPEVNNIKTSLRILIVDDNRDNADSLAMLLKMMGNETRTAYDGKEAITLATEFKPSVMLLDIGLPKLNGYEVCKYIRQQPWGKQVLMIAQTGWGQDEDREKTRNAGFNHHLVKPVDPQTINKLLASVPKDIISD